MKIFQLPVEPFKAQKAYKTLVILIITLVCISITGFGVLSYFYYRKYKDYQSLESDKQSVESELSDTKNQVLEGTQSIQDYEDQISELEYDIDELTEENTSLEETNTTLEEEKSNLQLQLVNYQNKQAKIKQYNDVLNYMYTMVSTHGGFSGWTEAEFQAGRSLAIATGDNTLVAAVDAAWNDVTGDPVVRFTNVMKAIVDGINANMIS